jgi:hypothetical protein
LGDEEPSMMNIQVISDYETADGYRFDIAVEESGWHSNHTVTLSRADYERWGAEGGMSPATVARRSVEVLVRRAGRGRLRERFDVCEAMQLYPAFEAEAYRTLE